MTPAAQQRCNTYIIRYQSLFLDTFYSLPRSSPMSLNIYIFVQWSGGKILTDKVYFRFSVYYRHMDHLALTPCEVSARGEN